MIIFASGGIRITCHKNKSVICDIDFKKRHHASKMHFLTFKEGYDKNTDYFAFLC